MSKGAIFHPEAEEEFIAAINYYAGKSGGLGERFDAEIRRLVLQIEIMPHRHGPWRYGTRRARARRFPYLVVFAERATSLLIVAVAHKRKHPEYWATRMTP